MKLRYATATAALAALISSGLPAGALAAEGFYVGAGAGVNWTRDADLRDLALPGNDATADFDLGGIANLSAGYATQMGLRGELEFAWRWRNAVDEVSGANLTGLGSSGKVNSLAVMANVFYDLDLGIGVKPYIGAGIGGTRVRMKLDGTSDSDYRFAYQGIVGASYDITDNLAATVDYRYFAVTKDPKFDVSGTTIKGEYENHTVMVGLRYAFGGPARSQVPMAAAPVPQAPPAAQQNDYLLFFDWNKADITPASERIIADAAASAGQRRAVGIHVVGHTDSSGTPGYNQRLSNRRAEAVRRALVARGIPADRISVEGKGENQLLTQTGANVREPSNRRAEVIIRVQ
ncbi:OmpA family protein [Azospirillum sp. SYSU D00513]|uniref:OmpA family protein n=1 Tax=Azospirillum sp. SYSU D00513 TaxID=2812561 RepID=UPI001A9745DB|nr:OmpA family protein [Azospirillum sp. SYSU D00513]